MKKYISVTVCLVLLLSLLLTGCSKEVAVDVSGLSGLTSSGAATGMTQKDYTATLTPTQNYVLPQTVTVTVDGTVLTEGYVYDSATGALTIPGSSITGDIAIAATAPESILGTWEGEMDLAAMMADALIAGDELAAEYFTFEDLGLRMTMVFREDGTCSVTIDEASMQATMEALMQQLMDGFYKLIEAMLAEEDMDMSVEDFLDAAGVSTDALVEEILREAMNEEALAELAQECNYKAENGKLYLSDDLETEVTDDDASDYTLENGILTIQMPAEVDEENAQMAQHLFPLVLKRAS